MMKAWLGLTVIAVAVVCLGTLYYLKSDGMNEKKNEAKITVSLDRGLYERSKADVSQRKPTEPLEKRARTNFPENLAQPPQIRSDDILSYDSASGSDIVCTAYNDTIGGPAMVNPTCWLAPAVKADRRRDKDTLTIANFNAEWLFLNGHTSVPWNDFEKAKEHIKKVADVIKHLDADIINLNEVGSCQVLHELIQHLPDSGYNYYMSQVGSGLGQHSAFLSRVDPVMNLYQSNKTVPCGSKGNPAGCEKHYVTRFELKNGSNEPFSILLAGVHLYIGKNSADDQAKREAQSGIVRDAINEIKKNGDLVVVTGDFNDYDDSALDRSGNTSQTRALEILRTGLNLVNGADKIKLDDRYTAYHSTKQIFYMIDHTLMCPELYERIESAQFHRCSTLSQKRVSDHRPSIFRLNVSGQL